MISTSYRPAGLFVNPWARLPASSHAVSYVPAAIGGVTALEGAPQQLLACKVEGDQMTCGYRPRGALRSPVLNRIFFDDVAHARPTFRREPHSLCRAGGVSPWGRPDDLKMPRISAATVCEASRIRGSMEKAKRDHFAINS